MARTGDGACLGAVPRGTGRTPFPGSGTGLREPCAARSDQVPVGQVIEDPPRLPEPLGDLADDGQARGPYRGGRQRGAIVGLSRFHTGAHLARATLEAICYQSRDVVEAMERDSGVRLEVLKVDGGVTANDLCMQLQADILGVPVSRPVVAETTALGTAYAAGLATGFWRDTAELRANWHESKRWAPSWSEDRRAAGYAGWRKAVQRTLDWVDVD